LVQIQDSKRPAPRRFLVYVLWLFQKPRIAPSPVTTTHQKTDSKLDGKFLSLSHDGPYLRHANSPCSSHTESRWMLWTSHAPSGPRDEPQNRRHHKRFCPHRLALSPTGGSDYSPAVAHRAFWLISGFFSPPSTPFFFIFSPPARHSARQPTGVPQLALLLSLLNIPHAATGLGSGEAERGKNPHFCV
jgi:hypothetical protein